MQRYQQNLEVTSLINKVNLSSSLIEELITDRCIKDLYKYSKLNVLEDDSDENEDNADVEK